MSEVPNIQVEYAPVIVSSYFGGIDYFRTPIVSIGGRFPCHYCGSNLSAETEQCPACGARDWDRTKKGH